MRIPNVLGPLLLALTLLGCVGSDYEPGVPKDSGSVSDSDSSSPIPEAVDVAGAWTCSLALVAGQSPAGCSMVLEQGKHGLLGGSYAVPKMGAAGEVLGFVFGAKVDLFWVEKDYGDVQDGWPMKATASPSMMVGVWGKDKEIPFTAWR